MPIKKDYERTRNMIAELFYPKELKDVIADLRAKNDLNEEAIDTLNKQPNTLFLLWLVASVILIVGGGYIGVVVAIISFIIIVLLSIFLLSSTFNKNMAAYVFGKKKTGVVERSYYVNANYPTKIIRVRDSESSKMITIAPGAVWGKKSKIKVPEVNETISYYQADNKKYGFMPDAKEVKSMFSLSKIILKGEKHD